jgi:hypothetical protein
MTVVNIFSRPKTVKLRIYGSVKLETSPIGAIEGRGHVNS